MSILVSDFACHRDELIISTKAGHDMWNGPYGMNGSRKHLLASLDQSLKRLRLSYVDIFYSHCPDPDTRLEETMSALATAVHSGSDVLGFLAGMAAGVVLALFFGGFTGGFFNVDMLRAEIERMPAHEYLRSSYYEHWLHAIEALLIRGGAVTDAELKARIAELAAASRKEPH